MPEYGPKLERMSVRTMPLSVRTFGPLEPSPGNGPAVSSGTASVTVSPLLAAVVAVVAPVVADAAVVVVVGPAVEAVEDSELSSPHTTRRRPRPAPPKICRARRRSMRAGGAAGARARSVARS